MDDFYENIDNYNTSKKRKILIAFDEMIADITKNKRFQATIKDLFIRYIKLNISLVFITQSYFFVPKDVRLNSTHYLIMKINNRKKLTIEILQTLITMILWEFTENAQMNLLIFWQ